MAEKYTEKYLEANKNTYVGKHFDALPDEEKEKFITELEKKPSKYTEAQKRASLKYQANKAQIKITVSKEQREKYKRLADSKSVTLTELIVSLLEGAREDFTRRVAYKVILTEDPEGYLVTVPDFNCNTQGKDIAEAMFMARDVIKLMASTMEEIPKPGTAAYELSDGDIETYVDVEL